MCLCYICHKLVLQNNVQSLYLPGIVKAILYFR